MTNDPLTRIADDIAALVDPTTHIEGYVIVRGAQHIARAHRVHTPGLLQQMREQIHDATERPDERGGKNSLGSKPPTNLDVIDRLAAITRGVQEWRGIRQLPHLETELRHLVGDAANHFDLDEQQRLAHDTDRWVTWARIVTGWDTPPFRPHVPCPDCGDRALRIHLGDANAYCAHCGTTWDRATLGILAARITAADQQELTERVSPCQNGETSGNLDGEPSCPEPDPTSTP